jgi:argininosuccinate lyase
MWSGRFSGPPNKQLFAFGTSLAVDRRLIDDDITGSQAWAEALGQAGVLPAGDVAAILGGLESIRAAVSADPSIVERAPDEDVHALVERLLIERIGDAGRRLHTGRSRNEQVSLDTRLYLKRRIPGLERALVDLVAAFVEQAAGAGEAVMPSYTHLRRAQPVLAAHMWLAHAAAVRRDVARLEGVLDDVDWMPLGSGAIAGTAYAVDTGWLCQRLGFSRVVPNSIDSSGDRDFVASFLFACTLAMTHLSRLAEDVILFTSEEFGFFDLADEVATGSSLMPQKKNPDPMELVRGKAGTTLGLLVGWLAAMKGTPLGYNKDYQEDKSALFAAEDALAGCAMASAAIVRAMTPRPERMREAASGLLLATEVADYLVGRGMPFRSAHALVGRIVRDLVAAGRDFNALSLTDWQRYDPIFDDGIFPALTPEAAVRARVTPQSTNPGAVAEALADTRAWIAARTQD